MNYEELLLEHEIESKKELKQRKQLHKNKLKNTKSTSSKTIYSSDGFKNSALKNKETVYLNKEEVLSMDNYEINKVRYEALSNEELFCVEKNPNELDYKLFELLYGNNITPIFFNNKKSSSFLCKSAKNFFKLKQYNNSYYMPVTLRDFDNRKTVTRSREDIDLDTGEAKKVANAVNYVSTDRKNINAVLELVIDIDFHDKNLDYKELEAFANSVDFFSMEANIQPTAIVVTGRGIQLHYILKDKIYRNSENVDKLLKKSYEVLKKTLNNEVLTVIDMSAFAKCDDSLNPINQKVRVPGTLNFSSMTYAHVVVLNEDRLYNLGQLLSEKLGDYEEYRENQEKLLEELRNKKGNYHGNNGNGRHNIFKFFDNRISDITNAIVFTSEELGTGFRNNGYLTLVWQYINLKKFDESLNDNAITQLIFGLDQGLSVPYFKNLSEAERFVKSTYRTIDNAKTIKLKNTSIENFCMALQYANDYNQEMTVFFKETVTEKRLKKKLLREESNEKLKKNIKMQVIGGSNVSSIAIYNKVARNTVYKVIKELLESFGISIKGLTGSLDKLRKALLKEIINNKKSKTKGVYYPKEITGRDILPGIEYNSENKELMNLDRCRLKKIKRKNIAKTLPVLISTFITENLNTTQKLSVLKNKKAQFKIKNPNLSGDEKE